MNEGEIAGASAEVADQDELVMIESRFVIVSGGDRLHFELDRVEACKAECFAEAGFRVKALVVILGAHEANRASDHGLPDLEAELTFGLLAKVLNDSGNQLFEGAAAAEHFSTQ